MTDIDYCHFPWELDSYCSIYEAARRPCEGGRASEVSQGPGGHLDRLR